MHRQETHDNVLEAVPSLNVIIVIHVDLNFVRQASNLDVPIVMFRCHNLYLLLALHVLNHDGLFIRVNLCNKLRHGGSPQILAL